MEKLEYSLLGRMLEMSMMSIAEILAAVAFFAVLGVVSYIKEYGKKEDKTSVLHNPAYIMYE